MEEKTLRHWLPEYCKVDNFLPTVQETVILFAERPFVFSDFVARAITFLQSEPVRKMGFNYDPVVALPCKWKCSDESVFGVDLALYAFTGHFPFDKGKIGGEFNAAAVAAAVHHSKTNIDFGGSHVGYVPDVNGGKFGHIQRPLNDGELSTDCGHVMGIIAPFKEVYDDACRNILLCQPEGERVLVSVPNEFLQPTWSSDRIKLLVDIERLTAGVVPYDVRRPHTHKLAGRSLSYASDEFLERLNPETRKSFSTPKHQSIGGELTSQFFHIYDSQAASEGDALKHRYLPYMKYILSSRVAPYPVKAAVTSANIEYNRLTDCIRKEHYRPYSFASFTGVFIDVYDTVTGSYVNLFQPIGIAIKVAGRTREYEISAAEVHETFNGLEPAEPKRPLKGVLGYDDVSHVLDGFDYQPEFPKTPTLGQSRRG